MRKRIDDLALTLSPRMKCALCAACAERTFVGLYQCPDLPIDVAEQAIELLWTSAQGHDVQRDRYKAVAHQLHDAIDALYSDMMAFESAATFTLDNALDALDPEQAQALQRTVASVIDGCQGIEAYEHECYQWLEHALQAANATSDVNISRNLFPNSPPTQLICYLSHVESIDDIDDLDAEIADVIADTYRKQRVRMERIRGWLLEPTAAWLEPNGVPEHLVVKVIGRTASSSEGKLITPGHDLVAVFARQPDRVIFAPTNAVAIGMSPDQHTVFSWRVEKISEESGTAREHYNWFVDSYDWPSQQLLGSYQVQDRETISWCWPVRIDVPQRYAGALVILRARSEDYIAEIYVVEAAKETTSKEQAVQWLPATSS
jgi:hypothetical protein